MISDRSVFLRSLRLAQIGSDQAANGINLPLADLIIGACTLELGYATGTHNARDLNRIPA